MALTCSHGAPLLHGFWLRPLFPIAFTKSKVYSSRLPRCSCGGLHIFADLFQKAEVLSMETLSSKLVMLHITTAKYVSWY
eukprot:Skav222609  [mRNA]  locus=scaffold1190:20239:21872:+ [translate_table: standard]